MISASFDRTFDGWRAEARRFLQDGVPPDAVVWDEATPNLFSQAAFELGSQAPNPAGPAASQAPSRVDGRAGGQFRVPAEFLSLAETLSCARDDDRWALLYRLLFRLKNENPNLLKILVDDDVHRALLLQKSIRRDIHKMHAFVRFKKAELLTDAGREEIYVAWHKPEHRIVKPAAAFFERRFGDRRWSIFTPEESAHWDLSKLTFGEGIPQSEFKTSDDWDEVWKTYYKSIFNPARIKMKAMKLEMAPKYWSTLPEATLIRDLVREAPRRLQSMAANHNRSAEVLPHQSLEELGQQVAGCRACPLFASATHAVFGVGPRDAELMIVGEQPGDQEDLAGLPFVGPAGEVLDEALRATELSRASIYLTNAVKHFKHELRGKLRLHKKASGGEMHACRPWLEAEIALVRPKIILALGTTAATAVLGRLPKISSERGQVITGLKIAPRVIVSWHPAAILRAATPKEANERRAHLCADLALASSCHCESL